MSNISSSLPSSSTLIFLSLPPENIVQFKNILESYDGLGIIRTVNKQTGEIVIITHLESKPTINELLASVASELSIRFTQKVPEDPEDWLLLSLKNQGEY